MVTVTGATGQLGRLVVRALLSRGVPAEGITAGVRSPDKAADLGVRTVLADYSRPQTLAGALDGTDRLLLISSSEVGSRIEQHSNVVEAAKTAENYTATLAQTLQHRAVLGSAGHGRVSAATRAIADSDLGIARGEVYTDSGTLSKLIGHPTTTLAEALELAIRA